MNKINDGDSFVLKVGGSYLNLKDIVDFDDSKIKVSYAGINDYHEGEPISFRVEILEKYELYLDAGKNGIVRGKSFLTRTLSFPTNPEDFIGFGSLWGKQKIPKFKVEKVDELELRLMYIGARDIDRVEVFEGDS